MRGFVNALRWTLRKLLRLLPAKPSVTGFPPHPGSIAYLFAGTYGDFVQALPALHDLARRFPGARLWLVAPFGLFRDFASELPSGITWVSGVGFSLRLLSPVDLLVTNAVGVYRVRFEVMARYGARVSLGFRYPGESPRPTYSFTLGLPSPPANFGNENLRLLRFGDAATQEKAGDSSDSIAKGSHDAYIDFRAPVLFHIGSAGLQKDFGRREYIRVIEDVLSQFQPGEMEIYHGPGEEELASMLRERHPGLRLDKLPMSAFICRIRDFQGTLLCFNSFMAHLCLYLDKPAIVFHRDSVPYGYDCSPLHLQVVLKRQTGYAVPLLRTNRI